MVFSFLLFPFSFLKYSAIYSDHSDLFFPQLLGPAPFSTCVLFHFLYFSFYIFVHTSSQICATHEVLAKSLTSEVCSINQETSFLRKLTLCFSESINGQYLQYYGWDLMLNYSLQARNFLWLRLSDAVTTTVISNVWLAPENFVSL